MNLSRKILNATILLLALFFLAGNICFAQDLAPDQTATMRARVTSIVSTSTEPLPGSTSAQLPVQEIRAEITSGAEDGTNIEFSNDYMPLKVGEVFYVTHTVDALEGYDTYQAVDVYRLPVVFAFIGLFILCVLLFGGWQGIRGLVSLAGSFVLIFKVMLPGILVGISPFLLAMIVSSLIIMVGSYVTHGFNKTTSSAVVGMILTVALVGVIAFVGVHAAHLTGFETEESTYLNINTNGVINFPMLLLAGMMIGLLGVLYDVAIGQAVSVEELHKIAPHISRKIIYTRALRIGREHVGALVNTLAIAYVGVSLPLLLYYLQANQNIWQTINREVFATEIIRTMVGSIGLVLAVPITTAISTFMLVRPKKTDQETMARERSLLEHAEHSHAHHH